MKRIQKFSIGYNQNSPSFSDFYQLAGRLFARGFGDNKRVLMVTSAIQGEGKTTISYYLSITCALSAPDFFLLLDGDLRRPNLHKQFGTSKRGGLSDILMGEKNLPELLRRTPYGNLHLMTAGKHVDTPHQLLHTPAMTQLINRIKNYYKIVIIDCPPMVPVSDTLHFAQMVDGVLLVIKAGKTPRTVVKRAIDLFRDARCPLLGVILNDTSEVLPYYYHHRYYKYDYSHNSETTS